MSQTQAASTVSNQGATGNSAVTFEGTQYPTTTHNYGTPMIYGAPSAFGFSPSNCGGSDTLTVGTPIGGFAGSHAKPMYDCNVRQDTVMLYQLGLREAAKLRMVCFGSDANRQAYEAAGGVCPATGTAKGIAGAPVGPKFEPAPQVAKTLYGTINADGTVTYHQK
jgi:hypothetical protein